MASRIQMDYFNADYTVPNVVNVDLPGSYTSGGL